MNITESLSPETRALADLFAAAPIGSTITFDAMSAALGRPIETRRHLIPRALHIASRETGAIFGSIRKVGYQRLPPQDAHILGSHTRRRMRRMAKRTSDAILAAVSRSNDMPDDARRRAYAEVNAQALIRHIAADKQVSSTVEAATKPDPVGHVMRRFAQQLGVVPE